MYITMTMLEIVDLMIVQDGKLALELKLTLNPHNKLAASSVPGLIVHFVSDYVWSLFKIRPRLLAH